MIIDYENQFSDAQAVTASAASTNSIDLKTGGDALARELELVVRVDTTADSAGDAATITIALQTDDNSSFSSAKTLFTTAAIAQASAVAGAELVKVKVPLGCERYLRVYYTIGTEDLTAGKFDAFLVAASQTNKNNPFNA